MMYVIPAVNDAHHHHHHHHGRHAMLYIPHRLSRVSIHHLQVACRPKVEDIHAADKVGNQVVEARCLLAD